MARAADRRIIVKRVKFTVTSNEISECVRSLVPSARISSVQIVRRGCQDLFCSVFVTVDSSETALMVLGALRRKFIPALSHARVYVEPAAPRLSWLAQAGRPLECVVFFYDSEFLAVSNQTNSKPKSWTLILRP